MTGPVGSLGAPDSEAGLSRYPAGDLTLHIHDEALAAVERGGRLAFSFGARGECEIRLRA